ncbi:MAG: DegT/DnrJ/EryC1/StrS family aminotransferase [Opitutae bacterium]|jgi:dTDP-4-amino-4,6-dideoxygalactose transaminase|nr:DegT/DnrJ/EryC1/StrS family aminotransferase [Opitutae bacterium]
MKVEFYRHELGQTEIDEITETIRSLFLTTGPKTEEFEQRFSDYLGTRRCLGVTSWTMGNFITLKALGVGGGDRVLTTPLTYIATANTILHAGAEPVFADVDPHTGNLNPEAAREVLDRDETIKGVIVVHLYGQMSDMKTLRKITNERGLFLLEDCAHCVEGVRDGLRPGALSDAAAFSFYATKNLTCGEGGAIVTNNDDLADRLQPLRLHGVDTYAKDQHKGKGYRHWDMTTLGYKCNMNDLSASLLLPQLDLIEERRLRRQKLCEQYDDLLADIESISTPCTIPGSTHAHHLYTIRSEAEDRDQILTEMSQHGVGVGVNFRVVHLMKYYRERFGFKRGDFPVAEQIGDSTISLPLYPSLKQNEQHYVVETLRKALAKSTSK